MWSYFRKRVRRVRIALGVARDTWDILVTLGLAAVPTGFVIYLSWAKEHSHTIILIAVMVFAAACAAVFFILGIAEKTRIFRRIKFQGLAPHVIQVLPETLGMTMRCEIVNRSQLPMMIYPAHVDLDIEDQHHKPPAAPLKELHVLPNDSGYIIVGTIKDVPKKPFLTGRLHLDIRYGMEDEEPEYRYEMKSDVQIVLDPQGGSVVSTPNQDISHSRIPAKVT